MNPLIQKIISTLPTLVDAGCTFITMGLVPINILHPEAVTQVAGSEFRGLIYPEGTFDAVWYAPVNNPCVIWDTGSGDYAVCFAKGGTWTLFMFGDQDSKTLYALEFVLAKTEYPDKTVLYHRHGAPADGGIITMACTLQASFEKINESGTQAYQATPNPSNAKRIAKGKKPLFDWSTVVIQPRKLIRNEPQGGTHASPRLHERRGHWRQTKRGKRVWVKPHKVGSAKDGIGFHHYEVRA